MFSIRESYFFAIWTALCGAYEASVLHRLLVAAGRWCNRRIDESRILGVLCREGAVARAWSGSRTCRILSFWVNLPGNLLHRLYIAFQRQFDQSIFAGLAFAMGDETAIGESWVIMALWVIPYERWNNAYNFLGFAALLVLFYAGSMRRYDTFRLDVKSVGPYAAGMFLAVVLGAALSAYPSLSARFLMYHSVCLLCVLVTVGAVRNTGDLKRLAAGGSAAVLISSLYAVYQRIQGVEINKSFVDLDVNAGMPGRVESFFDNPNTYAQMLILLLPIVLGLMLCAKRPVFKVIAAGVFTVGVGALGMTYSRASWVGIAAAMVVAVFLWKPKLIPLFIAGCLLVIPLLPSSILNRILTITNTNDTSTSGRIPLYRAALATIGKSPVTGAGLGIDAVQQFIKDNNFYHAKAPFVHAHNIYLQVWIETGLLGVVSFVGAMLLNIKNAARTVRHCGDSAARTLTCAAASSLCGIMVCGLADYPWHYPRVMSIFWFVFALCIAGTKLCRQAQQEEESR